MEKYKLDLEDEWKFIQSETHREGFSAKSALRRELVFCMQILLSNIEEEYQKLIYLKTKELYLSLL